MHTSTHPATCRQTHRQGLCCLYQCEPVGLDFFFFLNNILNLFCKKFIYNIYKIFHSSYITYQLFLYPLCPSQVPVFFSGFLMTRGVHCCLYVKAMSWSIGNLQGWEKNDPFFPCSQQWPIAPQLRVGPHAPLPHAGTMTASIACRQPQLRQFLTAPTGSPGWYFLDSFLFLSDQLQKSPDFCGLA